MSLLALLKAIACLVVVFCSLWISLAELVAQALLLLSPMCRRGASSSFQRYQRVLTLGGPNR
jgi:hypothetical protein